MPLSHRSGPRPATPRGRVERKRRGLARVLWGLAAAGLLIAPARAEQTDRRPPQSSPTQVQYKVETVDGVGVFYREAGPRDGPLVILLHGFPTSSHMYRDLIPLLARKYRVVAPDYPGSGFSSAPPPAAFAYTFDNLAKVMEGFVQRLGAERYVLYMQDFGGPVGLRMATKHPERIAALIVQNANAYEEGLSPAMDSARPAWTRRTHQTEAMFGALLSTESTRFQFEHGAEDPILISPDGWLHADALLRRPGAAEAQISLLHDYGSNVALYPRWQAYFRAHQPPTLVVWGENDPFFTVAGARAYSRDMPGAETHLLKAGHFALEEKAPAIAALLIEFLDRRVAPPASPGSTK